MRTGLRILVVDNDESIREVMVRLLEAEGHEVTLAVSGEDGLDLFREDP